MNSPSKLARRLVLLAVVALVWGGAASAQAQCAVPATSTFPAFMTACPRGDISYTAVLRDAAGVPCANQTLTMVVAPGCAGQICGPFTMTAVSNAAGVIVFSPQLGGCCPGPIDFVDVSGVVVGQAFNLNSPDQNGDCRVNLSDLALFAGVFSSGGITRCTDLTNDGLLNLSDVVTLTTHFGH